MSHTEHSESTGIDGRLAALEARVGKLEGQIEALLQKGDEAEQEGKPSFDAFRYADQAQRESELAKKLNVKPSDIKDLRSP